jgi:hypothetical protein
MRIEPPAAVILTGDEGREPDLTGVIRLAHALPLQKTAKFRCFPGSAQRICCEPVRETGCH